MLHIVLSLALASALTLCAFRDPFSAAHGCSMYEYSAFGKLHGINKYFALLKIDGVCYQIKEGQEIAGHVVLVVSEYEIVLKDRLGKEIKILRKEKALQLR